MTIARSRFIRPEFFTDERTGAMSLGAQLLFIGSWTQCDVNGILEWSAKQLRVRILPHQDGLASSQVQEWMDEVATLGLVQPFDAQGKRWAWVKNFRRYQSFTTGERRKGRLHPLPPWPIDMEKGRDTSKVEHESDHDGDESGQKSDHGLTKVAPQSDHSHPMVVKNGGTTPPPPPPPPPPPLNTPPPPYTCVAEPADSPAAATAALEPTGEMRPEKHLSKRTNAVSVLHVRRAVADEDGKALAEAFGVNTRAEREAEWKRDTDGIQIGEQLAVLAWRRWLKKPIREPSGFRMALAAWRDMAVETRRDLASSLLPEYGIPFPEPAAT